MYLCLEVLVVRARLERSSIHSRARISVQHISPYHLDTFLPPSAFHFAFFLRIAYIRPGRYTSRLWTICSIANLYYQVLSFPHLIGDRIPMPYAIPSSFDFTRIYQQLDLWRSVPLRMLLFNRSNPGTGSSTAHQIFPPFLPLLQPCHLDVLRAHTVEEPRRRHLLHRL